MKVFRTLSAFFCLFAIFQVSGNSQSPSLQSKDQAVLGHRVVDDLDRVPLRGNVHPLANSENRIGRSASNLPMERIILVLKRRPGGDEDLETLIAQQHDPTSPLFHQWLTPKEFGQRFGLSDDDLASITNWLESYGFQIDEVTPGRGSLNFSANADEVERAFQTKIDEFMVEGKLHYANSTELTIPQALSDLVQGVLSLHDFHSRPTISGLVSQEAQDVSPYFKVKDKQALVPGDFATIYNVKPLYSNGIDGTGQSIAVVGRSNINISDVRVFRSQFGLPAKDPVIILNGADPGNLKSVEEEEADLDVEWSGAVARNATIKFVLSKSTNSTGGDTLSAQYAVVNNVAPIMSMSFLRCESDAAKINISGTTTPELKFFNDLWKQAVSQGITVFVSAGDSGAAGCDAGSSTSGSGRGVSAICSTPYNVCVGGTQFDDTANPGLYWSTTSNKADQSSALSYIPERVWNESVSVSGGSGLWATGGGVSSYYAKPAWQAVLNVPPDGMRDVPDVSLAAAQHDGYAIVQGNITLFGWWTIASGMNATGGTSAATPSFAGLMALVEQKNGQRQGNANTVFYPIGQSQYWFGFPTVFHDIKDGNNSVPGVPGYPAGLGYDQATGLGSVDANALVNHWGAPGISAFAVSPSSIVVGKAFTANATVANSGGSSLKDFELWRAPDSGGTPGTWTQVKSIGLSGNGPTPVSLTDTPTVPGTYWYGAHVCNNASTCVIEPQKITVTVNPVAQASFTVSANTISQTVTQGQSASFTLTVQSKNGFHAAVTPAALNLPTGYVASGTGWNPPSVTPAANGTASSTLTVVTNSSTTPGTYNVTLQASATNYTTQTVPVTITVNKSASASFTVSANTASQTVTQGQSASFTLSVQSKNGFHATITPAALNLPTGYVASGTKWNPSTITPAANGSASSTLTVVTNSNTTPGTYNVTLQASATNYTTQTVPVTITVNSVAKLPTVTTGSAGSITASTATTFGTVNPNGADTHAWILISSNSSMSGAVQCPSTDIGSGTSAVQVQCSWISMSAGTKYYYQVVAQNSAGTANGGINNFTTSAAGKLPTVTTGTAGSITSSTATTYGTVNPNGADTHAWILISSNSSMSGAVQCPSTDIGSGTSAVQVQCSWISMSAGTKYYYQVVAQNSAGTANGGINNFTTSAPSNPPTVTTGSAGSITTSTATTYGTVNPNGAATHAWFLISLNSSMSGAVQCPSADIGSGTSSVQVQCSWISMSAGTKYYYRVVAQNSAGTANGGINNFTTSAPSNPPTVTTGSAGSITTSTATTYGTVNPNGADTHAWFLISLNSSMSGAVQCPSADIGSGTSSVQVQCSWISMSAGTKYYYQVVAQNSAGTAQGGINNFTTSAPSSPPTVTTGSAGSITNSTATTYGTVNPNGADTHAWFLISLNSSMSGAVQCPSADIGSGSSGVQVQCSWISMSAGTKYYYQVVAQNSAGTVNGGINNFTTSAPSNPPTVTTGSAGSITRSTATTYGSVNPNGSDTHAWFLISLNSSMSGAVQCPSYDAGSGNSTIQIQCSWMSMSASTKYYYQVVAQNSAGTAYGGINNFTTSNGTNQAGAIHGFASGMKAIPGVITGTMKVSLGDVRVNKVIGVGVLLSEPIRNEPQSRVSGTSVTPAGVIPGPAVPVPVDRPRQPGRLKK